MSRPNFYWQTTKKLIVAFATVFDELEVTDDFGRPYKVPLIFSQKEKFVEAFTTGENMNDTDFDITFPRMGFELSGINFAPERHVNPLNQILDTMDDGEEVLTYNRIPYDLTFDLFIGARKLEDSLKVLESIIPFFTPELTVTIRDREDFQLETNVPIVLNSTALQIDYEGSFDSRRQIMWTLNFTVKGYYYPDRRATNRIKQTILNFGDMDYERIFAKYTSTVNPLDAGPLDQHTIVDTVDRNYE
jgi:hypothetical protein